MKMVQLATREIRANLGRLVLTTIAIVAGVGFVSGAFILADSLENTFTKLFENANADVDAQIAVADLEFGQDTRTIPDTLVAEVDALPEVGHATPVVVMDLAAGASRPFAILDAAGNTIEPRGAPIVTFTWDGKEDQDLLTIADGVPPAGIDQVAIDSTYARVAGVEVGDRVTFATPTGQRNFQVATVVDVAVTVGEYYVMFDFASAQTLYDKQGQVDAISLSRAPGVTTDEMIAAVEAVIPQQATVTSQDALIEQQSADFEQIIGILRNVLLGFAGVALFVSIFIIYNTFAILVTQRLPRIGMLRALGATKNQIRAGVIYEGVIVGVVGSGLGIAFGLVVAFGIKSAFQAAGGFPDSATIVAPRTIVVALVVGMTTTLMSALVPSLLAGRVSPIAAMRNQPPSRSSPTRRITSGVMVTAAGLVLLGLGLFSGQQGTAALLAELTGGAMLTFVGVALLSVLFAGPMVNLIGAAPIVGASLLGLGLGLVILNTASGDDPGGVLFPIKMLLSLLAILTGGSILIGWLRGGRAFGPGRSATGLAGRLARQNATRSPQRTAATATALTIGVALLSTVGVVGESLKASFADTLDRAVRADLLIYDNPNEVPFSGELADQVDAVDGLAAVSRLRFNEIRIGDDIDAIAAFEADTGQDLIDFNISDGSSEGLLRGGVLVLSDVAEERSLGVGDTVAIEFPDLETEELVVAGIFEDNILERPWLIDLSVYERHITSDDDVYVAASFAEGADPAAVKAAVLAITDEYASVTTQDTSEYLKAQQEQVDGIITLITYLLAFALFVAFLGVINTIALSVIERTREVGLLRAVGMTRQQIRATIRWESVIVCLYGAVLGIVLGLLFAWAAVSAIPDDIIATVAIPYESVLFTIMLAALAGTVAAVLPARRAAKLDVLNAIANGA